MPRGGGRGASSKKSNPTSIPNEDDNIIFGDPSKASKKAKKESAGDGAPNSGLTSSQAGASDAPKKPDTRTLIGGASWTGKLPVNMLSEHCQKQKWAKPEYTMVSTSCSFWHKRVINSLCRARQKKAFPRWLYSRLPTPRRGRQ